MSDIAFRYTGDREAGEHHAGIPARNLTQEDYDALDAEQRKTVRGSTIYAKVEDEPAVAPPKDETKKAEAKK